MNNLTVIDWNKYIYKKKLELIDTIDNIDNIDTTDKLNNTPDSFKFNDVLKNHIVKINIFNMSYITFMMLKFLETSFIPSEIILNVIEIYNDDELHRLLLINRKIIKNTNINYKLETYKYIKILKYIITTIIDFVVKTELALNIQCLLMSHFIDKIHNNKTNVTGVNTTEGNTTEGNTTEGTTTKSTINNKSFIFRIFSNINKDIVTNIKSSTLILLFLKLVDKFNTTYDDTNLLYFTNEYYNTNFTTFINKKHNINKKTKLYLDTFMLDITKYFLIDNNIHNIINPDIYIICNKYILNNIELIFNNFENIYAVLESHLLQSININENKKVKLSYLKNVITNIVDIEIDKIKKLFI
jgi:hypothetical protein